MNSLIVDYRILDHTADIGLEAQGNSPEEAFINAAKGLFAILVSGPPAKNGDSFSVEIEASNFEELLVGWLNKLIYLYDVEKVILNFFEFTLFNDNHLAAKVSGEAVNYDKHKIQTYIKAATYHQTQVKKNGLWKVKVFFDV